MSKKQTLITQSSTEAEYVATVHTAREIYWLRSFLSEVGVHEEGPTKLWVDNLSTIAIAKNNKFHAQTKHIDIQHHLVHKPVEHSTIAMEYIPTSESIADSLTKPLSHPAFEIFICKLGLLPA